MLTELQAPAQEPVQVEALVRAQTVLAQLLILLVPQNAGRSPVVLQVELQPLLSEGLQVRGRAQLIAASLLVACPAELPILLEVQAQHTCLTVY